MGTLVFVYGTLRKGESNHHLISGCGFCGCYVTQPRYRMLHLGTYPGVVAGGFTAIAGEVYRLNARELRTLDRLEAYPRLYKRALIATPWGRAWIYLYRGGRTHRRVLPGGDWRGQSRPGRFSL